MSTTPVASARAARAVPDDDPPSTVAALLNRPDLAGVVTHLLAFSAGQRERLSHAWADTHATHGISQIRICHRVSKAAPAGHPDQAAARAWIWTLAARPGDGHHGAAAAAADMAFVLLAGDLLSPAERALFDAPWRAVCATAAVGRGAGR